MKLIEALKELKEIKRKTQDLLEKIGMHCAYLSFETPTYPEQSKEVAKWVQAHRDLVQRSEKLTLAIHKTNLATEVTVELGGNKVTKPIAAWILRRRGLAVMELQAWGRLTDKNLKEGHSVDSSGNKVEIKIVRCYDPAERDKWRAALAEEPFLIDAKLEVANAITDLME